MDKEAGFRIESGRTRADLIGCVASLVDALAGLTFLVLPTTAEGAGRLCTVLLVDPITCIIVYCMMYRRLVAARPKFAELGFYLVISGTLFLTGQNVLEMSARLNFFTLNYFTANGFDILLEMAPIPTLCRSLHFRELRTTRTRERSTRRHGICGEERRARAAAEARHVAIA